MMNERIKLLAEQATSYTWNGNDVTEELDEQKFRYEEGLERKASSREKQEAEIENQ